MARLFVAAYPPASVADGLAALGRSHQHGIRWTPQAQWHVTLQFLGDIDEGYALDAFSVLRARSAHARLGQRIARLGQGAIAVPVMGLNDLARSVRSTMASVLPEDQPRSFVGHLTLGRAKGATVGPLVDGEPSGEWIVDEVVLVHSALTSDGAVHTTVARRALLPAS